MIQNLTDFNTILDLILMPEHRVLAHYTSLESIRQEIDDSKRLESSDLHDGLANPQVSYKDAIKDLLTTAPDGSVHSLLNGLMLERVKSFEKKFNGEFNNILRDVSKDLYGSPKVNPHSPGYF